MRIWFNTPLTFPSQSHETGGRWRQTPHQFEPESLVYAVLQYDLHRVMINSLMRTFSRSIRKWEKHGSLNLFHSNADIGPMWLNWVALTQFIFVHPVWFDYVFSKLWMKQNSRKKKARCLTVTIEGMSVHGLVRFLGFLFYVLYGMHSVTQTVSNSLWFCKDPKVFDYQDRKKSDL